MQEHQVNPGDNHTKEPLKSSPKFSAKYLGSMPVSRLYSQTVQPWVMAEIHRKRENIQDVVIEVCGESLIVHKRADEVIVHRRADQEHLQLLFQHHLKGVTRFAKMHHDAKCFAYLTRYEITADFQCHVYLTDFEAMIPQLFKAIRDASKNFFDKSGVVDTPVDSKSGATDGGDPDRCKSMFEVKYLGRAKLGSRRVTSDYIDNLAERLIAREARSVTEKLDEVEQERQRHASGASVKSLPETLEDVAEDLVTENNLEQQIEMMKSSGLRSCPFVEGADSTLGTAVVSGSTSLQTEVAEHVGQQTEVAEHVGQPISGDTHSNSGHGLSASFEQKSTYLNPGKGQGYKVIRESTTDGVSRRRHSSQTDDRSWTGSKFTLQDPANDRQHQDSIESQDSICSVHRQHEGSRIMVLQIGQQNICLISLDKKVSVLDCKFTDISFVSQGSHKQDFFGIVVRDSGTTFYCYILRCLSQAMVEEILSTLQTAFTTACSKRGENSSCTVEAAAATHNHVCSTCPLHHFHKICQEIHALSSQAAYELIVKKVHCLPDKEFNELNRLMQIEAPESFEETLEVMMIFLRQLCERKQRGHVHISETSRSSRSDMTLLEEKQSLLEGLKNKAKKSITTSFEHLLTRGKKKDDASDSFRQRSWTTDSETSWTSRDSSSSTTSTPDVSPMPSPRRKETHHDFPSPPSSPRRRSATMDIISHPDRQLASSRRRDRDVNHNTTASPMKTMFLLSTSSPQHSESLSSSTAGSSPLEDTNLLTPLRRPSSSWRKAIFNKVCTPQHSVEFGEECPQTPDGKLHNTADVRAMWRKLILESLLLIRMEKENHSIRARQEEDGAMQCHKLEYQELTPCLKEITCTWEKMLAVNDGDEEEFGKALLEEEGKTVPRTTLLDYVKKGVPRSLRGQIWLFLMQQQQMCNTVPDSSLESASYEDLLKQLTMHQHAILIDLGRTFPSHPYFSKSLGTGQLELFNLLKAYSLLDSEVGYCQGLSFIVGMLLMHMEEISSFHVLKYLMYDLGLRKQFRPNMTALQLKLYQLTRLLHDRHKNVYDHFETHEISPTLYAAPWFLTMFASQFPLGFVARVFDMIFIQGIDALFKVALTLIGSHNALILQCDSFETIVDFLKITLPEMVQVQMERIINQAFELDLDRELQQYEVEYYVLSEEMTFSTAHHHYHSQQRLHKDKSLSPPAGLASDRLSRPAERRRSVIDVDMVYRLENQNLALTHQNTELMEKLEQAQYLRQSSEVSVFTQQIEMDKLKSRIRSLELERAALLTAVAKLRQLIPRETLQQLQLSLPTTSTSPLGLGDVSDRKTFHGLASQDTDLTLNERGTAQLPWAHQVVPSCDTNSVLSNDGTTFLSSYSEAISNSNKNCTDLNSSVHTLASSQAKGSSISAHHKSVSVTNQTHEAGTPLPATTATPLYTLTSSTLTSTSDISRGELHSQRTRTSAGVDAASLAGLPSQLPSSSSCAAQTCTPRTISNTSNNLVTVGAIPPERRQNTVVVQQSTTMKSSQTSPSSHR